MRLYCGGDSEVSRDYNDLQQNLSGTCSRRAEVWQGQDVMAGLMPCDGTRAEPKPYGRSTCKLSSKHTKPQKKELTMKSLFLLED